MGNDAYSSVDKNILARGLTLDKTKQNKNGNRVIFYKEIESKNTIVILKLYRSILKKNINKKNRK